MVILKKLAILSVFCGFAVAQTKDVSNRITNITGSTQCLHVNSAGLISGTGSDCGVSGGTVTVVGGGSLTSTALVTGGGTTLVQTPSATATLDTSGNIATPGGITLGTGGSVAGYYQCGQGTAPSLGTSAIQLVCPTSVTSYQIILPGASGSGLLLDTAASNVDTISRVALGSGVQTFLTTPSGANFNAMVAGGVQVAQNSQSTAYTTVLSDGGKQIYHPSSDTTARTWTIDSNANVAYPIGTTITFVNDTSAGTITISITADTLVLAGTGSTGSRTLAANGVATAIKVGTTRWVINGTGIS
jgi:hypothetical protein